MSGIAVTTPTEWDLLRRREPRSLQSFLQRLHTRADRVLLGRYGRHLRPVLQEAVHDGFLLFLQKLEQTEEPSLAKAERFALGIVRRTFLNALRRERRHGHTGEEELSGQASSDRSTYTSAGALLADRYGDTYYQWYTQLPAEQQHCLDLQLQGYNLKEVSELLGRSHGTVRNWMSAMKQEGKGFRSVKV